MNDLIAWLAPIASTALTAYLTSLIARSERKTDAKRAKEAEWRQGVDARLDAQDDKIAAVLKGQTTQMRSDLIHRAHRYVDDLGCASVEEKEAFWAEYEDYVQICDANNVVNNFIDQLAKRVMALPERSM